VIPNKAGCDSTITINLTVNPPAVGEFIYGGVVFWTDGNGGGLVVSLVDQSTGRVWGCYGTDISGADGSAVGTGAQNTIDIEAGCTTAGTAADLCANLTSNGYSDWFLPSKDELETIYPNLTAINTALTSNGGTSFSGTYYWSSTELSSYPDINAQIINFTNGLFYAGPKNEANYSVRAVRAF